MNSVHREIMDKLRHDDSERRHSLFSEAAYQLALQVCNCTVL